MMIENKGDKLITIYFEEIEYRVPEGISVAAAILGHIHADYTSINIITGEQCAPHCLMGVCFDCLVEIDDLPNQQSCMISVKDGMRIKKQMTLVETN
ncbi:MAG: (2Fe-2S)-binding protein [Desulfobacula sp.]|jgi:predicted molibdopterin-dependent oxidoreductase YjgC|nr:(2Fe-2S)-binding protein [Desulfobacula sp.]